MTEREKIYLLKDTIQYLFEKEGRSKNYISKLLEVDRKTLSNIIDYEFKFTQIDIKKPKPSIQKFINKNRLFIKSRLDKGFNVNYISKELSVNKKFLTNEVILKDKTLKRAYEEFKARKCNKNDKIFTEKDRISTEKFKEINNYRNYKISNYGRILYYDNNIRKNKILSQSKNKDGYLVATLINNRGYKKTLKIHRLVAYYFKSNNNLKNIKHIDGDKNNNYYKNLKWY